MTLYNTQVRLWLIAVFAIGSLIAGVTWQIFEDRSRTLQAAEKEIEHITQLLEASTATTFRSAELVADHISTITLNAFDGDGDPSAAALDQWVAEMKVQDIVNVIAFIRPDGMIPNTVVRDASGAVRELDQRIDASGREPFLVHTRGADTPLYIGSPRLGSEMDQWLVPITRSVRDSKASILNVESMVFPIFANCDSSLIREDFPCQQHYHQRFERVSNNTSKRA